MFGSVFFSSWNVLTGSKMDASQGGGLYAPEEEELSRGVGTAPQPTPRNRPTLKGRCEASFLLSRHH